MLTADKRKELEEEFIITFTEKIKRKGSEMLLEWIKGTDFFTAPASTRFHGDYAGGLLEHSLNVYRNLVKEAAIYNESVSKDYEKISDETIALVALCHDLCKTNFYKTEMRNVKNPETKVWEEKPFYTVDDSFPYGHGEKSAYLVGYFVKLTASEMMAIRWHMGGFDDSVKGGSYAIGNAFEKYPLAVLLHVADLKATYLDEGGNS